MASEAQILANRRNAEKSTGPRTEEGKAASARNSLKHGLFAWHDLISSEDREVFDRHRDLMLAELDPAGPLEHLLAERIVSLAWRLKRVERMQNEALDCLLAEDALDSGAESGELGSFEQTADSALGRAAVKDFAGTKVLDRLLMYERRIEHSLYKTMSELDRMKLVRPFDADRLARRPASPTEGPSYKTNPIPAGVGSSLSPSQDPPSRHPGIGMVAQGASDRVLVDAERPDRYRGPLDERPAQAPQSLGQSRRIAS
jgi:hypothetical protein